ncbi:flagellar basal body P-ring protein FlgI [Aestuariivirga litoralis]|uniref:flagellar basal body P-ring protein FlgI n=1 Tax=Aestuariivirga litoralis TaxID=2650924 RepID=UPI0018C5C7BB|nr:flagellar basal body P-ring protein FlgI [Aestuariivirga litoralis]MBG1233194.1 flagellar basal body P-ring protein FlgI [Aestuariivirga litoralis]
MKALRWLVTVGLVLLGGQAFAESRIKDVTTVQGMRDNQLVGYGLVIGLAGTGDSLKSEPFTGISMQSMLNKLGVKVEPGSVGSKNVAAVVVTATLPPFIAEGSRIDVSVSSLGDSTSLNGGVLVMTPLVAANGDVYAVGQGPVAAGGFSAGGAATTVTQGVPTTGRIPNGAIVEKDNTTDINALNNFALQLTNPDFRTATLIEQAINNYATKRYGQAIAKTHDFRSVDIVRPESVTASQMFSELGQLTVTPETSARIVIDEKNGTIVMGESVRLSPVAVSHGSIVIKVTEQPIVSQPNPLSNGETKIVPSTDVAIDQSGSNLAVLQGPTLERLVMGLNRMGLKPTDMIAILQSIKAAGALQADLIIQ